MQMGGLLVGGIFWGVLGDRKGRLSVLFGSIFIYSIANILNAFVHDVSTYAILRFVAGLGLAGELGAGVTLVCELMDKGKRGYGTMIINMVGIMGAVLAAVIGDVFDWRVAYIFGGVMGLALLFLRMGVRESGIFSDMRKKQEVHSGNFLLLLKTRKNLFRYLAIIIVGVPIWYAIGILITFSPEFGAAFAMQEIPSAGRAVMFCYIGTSLGGFVSSWLSQLWQSRKKVLIVFVLFLLATVLLYFQFAKYSLFAYYSMCLLIGVATGYWAIFITVATEQFGTNLRATATTTTPNFVRASVIPMTIIFESLKVSFGVIGGVAIVGAVCFAAALYAIRFLPETFHRDLNYLEE
jgi:MFS family permease